MVFIAGLLSADDNEHDRMDWEPSDLDRAFVRKRLSMGEPLAPSKRRAERGVDTTSNEPIQFMAVFDDILEGIIIDRQTSDDAVLTAFLDKPDFREASAAMIGDAFYGTIRQNADLA